MVRMTLAGLVVFGLAACGDDGLKAIDALIVDSTYIDAPDPGCGIAYTGEYVDWDSTESASGTFLGINAATFTVRDDATRTASTAPNGRFVMCIPDGNFSLVDIVPPADYLPGMTFAKRDVLAAGALPSLRSMTAARRDSMFTQIGAAYDPTAGQVFVHFNGTTPHKATLIDHASAAVQAAGADGPGGVVWAAGDTGTYVFFPNVNLGATANVAVTSDAVGVIGTAAIPLVPGAISYVELFVP